MEWEVDLPASAAAEHLRASAPGQPRFTLLRHTEGASGTEAELSACRSRATWGGRVHRRFERLADQRMRVRARCSPAFVTTLLTWDQRERDAAHRDRPGRPGSERRALAPAVRWRKRRTISRVSSEARRRCFDTRMGSRPRRAASIATVAGLLAAAEVVWVLVYLDRAGDGPAFAMALVVTVVVPTLLVASVAVLVTAMPRWPRIAATAAVAASGVAAAGVEAGIFVADEPADPAFIHWVAALPLPALIAAMLLIGCAAWRLLEPLPPMSRVILTAVAAVVGPVLLAMVVLVGMPFVMLVALGAPVALVPTAVVAARRERRHAPI